MLKKMKNIFLFFKRHSLWRFSANYGRKKFYEIEVGNRQARLKKKLTSILFLYVWFFSTPLCSAARDLSLACPWRSVTLQFSQIGSINRRIKIFLIWKIFKKMILKLTTLDLNISLTQLDHLWFHLFIFAN